MAFDEALTERIRNHLIGQKGVVEKKMFGGVAFLLNGNMCVGVNKDDLIVRLAPDETAAALKKKDTRIFDLSGGRPMQGWILVSPKGLAAPKQLKEWIDVGVAYAKSLPAKVAKLKAK